MTREVLTVVEGPITFTVEADVLGPGYRIAAEIRIDGRDKYNIMQTLPMKEVIGCQREDRPRAALSLVLANGLRERIQDHLTKYPPRLVTVEYNPRKGGPRKVRGEDAYVESRASDYYTYSYSESDIYQVDPHWDEFERKDRERLRRENEARGRAEQARLEAQRLERERKQKEQDEMEYQDGWGIF